MAKATDAAVTITRPTSNQYGMTDLVLLSPPWPPYYSPSTAICALAAHAEAVDPTRIVRQEHSYLRWLRTLRDEFGPVIGTSLYSEIAEAGAYTGLGDLVFRSRAEGRTDRSISLHETDVEARASKLVAQNWNRLNLIASTFVDQEARRVSLELPASAAVLGISSTFVQTFAGLAIAGAVKQIRPDTYVVLGGANYWEEKAQVFLEQFDFIDAVVFGEGEAPLVKLLRTIDLGLQPRSGDGVSVREYYRPSPETTNATTVGVLDPAPSPATDAYFEQVTDSELGAAFRPRLSWELSRGCWWGEKRHCTFCGLNGSNMEYRPRRSSDTANEILAQLERHRLLDVIFVDNILHIDAINEVIAQFPPDLDIQVHLEVKSNLTFEQLRRLRDHGVWHVQPGIESLARRTLHLMRKGVTPLMNVKFLRDCERLGMTVAWNILAGFPDETIADYAEMLQQIPRLHHLQPPGSTARLMIVRFSPLFEEEGVAVDRLKPADFNALLWPSLGESDLFDVSDVFVSNKTVGLSDSSISAVQDLVHVWEDAYPRSLLTSRRTSSGAVVIEQGSILDQPLHTLTEEWEVAVWAELEEGLASAGRNRLKGKFPGLDRPIAELIAELEESGVLFRDRNALLALPTEWHDHKPTKIVIPPVVAHAM